MGTKSRSGPGMNIPIIFPAYSQLRNIYWVKNTQILEDSDPGYGILLTLDPGWKNSDPG
jgi:hypothetical protein